MRAIGIDLSDRSIEIVELRQRFGQFTILSAACCTLPEGLIADGVLMDIPSIAEHIRACAESAKPKALTIESASFSIPESKVHTHVFVFPRSLKNDEVNQAIHVQFSDYFPFEPEAMAFDWKVTRKSEQTQDVLVAACEQSYVDGIVALAQECSIEISGIDLESLSTGRAVLPVPKKHNAYVLIDSGARVTSLSIIDESGLQMTLSVGMAGEHLTEQIAKKRQLSREEAETLKTHTDLSDPAAGDIRTVFEDQYAPVFAEAKRMITFFETSSGNSVHGVYLCGGASQMAGMRAFVQDHIEKPVHVGHALQHIRHHDVLPHDGAELRYANAIGLALGLLDPKHRVLFNFLKQEV